MKNYMITRKLGKDKTHEISIDHPSGKNFQVFVSLDILPLFLLGKGIAK